MVEEGSCPCSRERMLMTCWLFVRVGGEGEEGRGEGGGKRQRESASSVDLDWLEKGQQDSPHHNPVPPSYSPRHTHSSSPTPAAQSRKPRPRHRSRFQASWALATGTIQRGIRRPSLFIRNLRSASGRGR